MVCCNWSAPQGSLNPGHCWLREERPSLGMGTELCYFKSPQKGQRLQITWKA